VLWSDRLLDFYVAPQDEADFLGLREVFLANGATPPPPPYPYSCRYLVIDARAVCLPMNDPRVRACSPIDFADRSACTPSGANISVEFERSYDPTVGDTLERGYTVITRGNSVIKYNGYETAAAEFVIASEDEADFSGLRAVFAGAESGQ
jgi:hypothetical protein